MARKPNYNFERQERGRRKAEKKAAKAKAKASTRTSTRSPAEPDSDGTPQEEVSKIPPEK